jgi:Tfp pilus assembly protein PilO
VTARLNSLSPRAQVALVSVGLLLVAVLGYFVLIAPKRSTASDLKKQTADVQAQIAQNQSSAFQQALPAVRSASVFSLAKAMPNQVEMPNVILQLSQLASDSGISFDAITPQASSSSTTTQSTDPFAVEPIQVTFTGNFYDLLAFLMRVRNLVRVDNGKLYSAGRLFDVSDISFAAGPKGFPTIQTQLTVNAFVPVQPQPAAPTSTTTTGTTTTSTGTTTTTSNPTSASPATSGGGS